MLLKEFIEKNFRCMTPTFETDEELEDTYLLPEIVKGLNEMGMTKLSKLHEVALPNLINCSRNKILVAHPGAGKTVALAITILHCVRVNEDHSQILVICATYEAVFQFCKILREMSSFVKTRIKIDEVVKSDKIGSSSAHVIVGAPKEVVALIKKGLLDMNDIRLAFFEDVDVTMTTTLVKENILKGYSGRLILSCVPDSLEIAKLYNPSCTDIDIIVQYESMDISTAFIKCETAEKLSIVVDVYNTLREVVHLPDPLRQSIVFCQTRETVDALHGLLDMKGLSVDKIHNHLSIDDRKKKFGSFLRNEYAMLICTNLMARAIDVPGLFAVVNYDMPCYPSQRMDKIMYSLRIGRAVRFGRSSVAINLVTIEEMPQLMSLGQMTEVKLK